MTFASMDDKRSIFSNIEKIKHLVNKDGKKFYFRDFLTNQQNEKQKRDRFVKSENSKLDDELQKEISFKKGILQIDGKPCVNPITVPDPVDAIKLSMTELNRIFDIPINIGPQLIKLGNIIRAASFCTNEVKAIQDVYMALKLKFPEARHVVAVWNIPTNDRYDGQNYCEDDEIGIGGPILKYLMENNISHRAVFVMRSCGEKLQSERIPCFLRAVEAVIKQAPYNTILKKEQPIENPLQDYLDTTSLKSNKQRKQRSFNTRGRGGGAGRGRGGHKQQERRVYNPPAITREDVENSSTPRKNLSPSYAQKVSQNNMEM